MVRVSITNSLGILGCDSVTGWIAQRLALIWPFCAHPMPVSSMTESVIYNVSTKSEEEMTRHIAWMRQMLFDTRSTCSYREAI